MYEKWKHRLRKIERIEKARKYLLLQQNTVRNHATKRLRNIEKWSIDL
jgi:hypothetical protein